MEGRKREASGGGGVAGGGEDQRSAGFGSSGRGIGLARRPCWLAGVSGDEDDTVRGVPRGPGREREALGWGGEDKRRHGDGTRVTVGWGYRAPRNEGHARTRTCPARVRAGVGLSMAHKVMFGSVWCGVSDGGTGEGMCD